MRKSSEKGQAVVLLAIAFVTLLGFTALAIDGGMVYADRRHAQSMADAASLAGGAVMGQYLEEHKVSWSNWNCSGSVVDGLLEAEIAAINRGLSNGITLDLDISDGHGVDAICSTGAERYIEVLTRIKRDTRTSFIQLFLGGPVQNSVEAVTRINPRKPFGDGYALLALNQDACSGNKYGAIFSGNIGIDVSGGGVFSNGCLTGNGASLSVNVDSAGVGYAGSAQVTHPNAFSPLPQKDDPLLKTKYKVTAPDCTKVPTYPKYHGGGTLIPAGNYPSIKLTSSATLEGGGLYCLSGDFDIQGSSSLSIDTSNGKTGVTIFMESGSFKTAGNSQVNLSAPPESPDPFPALRGILFLMAEGNTGTLILTGNSSSNYSGIVLAPDGKIEAIGNSLGIGFNTAFIGKDVEVGGTVDMSISFFANNSYGSPTSLELSK